MNTISTAVDKFTDHRREVTVTSDYDYGPYHIGAESDLKAVEKIIRHLMPIRDAGALKGRVVVACGGASREMRA